MDSTLIEGGCHCGAIRYRICGSPLGSMVCHCATCQRVSGAPVVAWLTVPAQAWQLQRGTPARYASSGPVLREFCPACGTQLTYRHQDDPATVDITTCSLDDPAAWPPRHHSWLSHSVRWLALAADGLPHYSESRTDHPAD